jgi:hypothetical protein
MGRREVVEQPGRVVAVVGRHGDVDDAPRFIEGLLKGVVSYTVQNNLANTNGNKTYSISENERKVKKTKKLIYVIVLIQLTSKSNE